MTLSDRIAAVYALDEKRTQGEWRVQDYYASNKKPETNETQMVWTDAPGRYIAECVARNNASYLASAPEMVSIIRALDKQGEKNLIVHGENVNRILSLQTQLTIAVEALESIKSNPSNWHGEEREMAQTTLKRIREG